MNRRVFLLAFLFLFVVSFAIAQCDSSQCELGDGTCIDVGQISNGKYCDFNFQLQDQKVNDLECLNDFECKTLHCIEGLCSDRFDLIETGEDSLLQKIINFLTGGDDDDDDPVNPGNGGGGSGGSRECTRDSQCEVGEQCINYKCVEVDDCTDHVRGECSDGSTIIVMFCSETGELVPTGDVCPPETTGCSEDITQMCDDGSSIVVKRCVQGVLIPTGDVCEETPSIKLWLIILIIFLILIILGIIFLVIFLILSKRKDSEEEMPVENSNKPFSRSKPDNPVVLKNSSATQVPVIKKSTQVGNVQNLNYQPRMNNQKNLQKTDLEKINDIKSNFKKR
jgi:hypothetical protein